MILLQSATRAVPFYLSSTLSTTANISISSFRDMSKEQAIWPKATLALLASQALSS